jgi:hypothetical protein
MYDFKNSFVVETRTNSAIYEQYTIFTRFMYSIYRFKYS